MTDNKITILSCDCSCDSLLQQKIYRVLEGVTESNDVVNIEILKTPCIEGESEYQSAFEDGRVGGRVLFLGCPVLSAAGTFERVIRASGAGAYEYVVIDPRAEALSLFDHAEAEEALGSKILSEIEILRRKEKPDKTRLPVNDHILVYGSGYTGLRVATELARNGGKVTIFATHGPKLSPGSLGTQLQGKNLLEQYRGDLDNYPNVKVTGSNGIRATVQSEGISFITEDEVENAGTLVFAPESTETASLKEGCLNLTEAYLRLAKSKGNRGDLIFLLDQGWSIPPEIYRDVLRLAYNYSQTSYGTVVVLSREIQVAASYMQQLFDSCREAGIVFVRYDGNPIVENDFGDFTINVSDAASGVGIQFDKPAFFVVPQKPTLAASARRLAEILGLRFSREDFCQPPSQWRLPNKSNIAHVLIVGPARRGMTERDIDKDALAAAESVGERLGRGICIDEHIPVVDEDKCAYCLTCVRLCPFNAMRTDQERQAPRVFTALCEGCGLCVGACPAKALQSQNLSDEALHGSIEALYG